MSWLRKILGMTRSVPLIREIDGPFGMVVASDVIRDGLGVELTCRGETVAEVFRCDANKNVVLNTFCNGLPIVTVEELIARAREKLGTFEDGTPFQREFPKPKRSLR